MPQLHLYVSKELASRVNDRANAAGMSTSRYIAELVKRDLDADWPDGFFDEVAGGWVGEPLERPPQGEFETRESLNG